MSLVTGTFALRFVQGDTSKLEVVVAVKPFTVTVIVPVVTPVGAVTFKEVLVAELTVAVVPLNRTVLLAAVVEKFVPVIVTTVPVTPNAGEKFVIVGVAVPVPVPVPVAVPVPVPVAVPVPVPVAVPVPVPVAVPVPVPVVVPTPVPVVVPVRVPELLSSRPSKSGVLSAFFSLGQLTRGKIKNASIKI